MHLNDLTEEQYPLMKMKDNFDTVNKGAIILPSQTVQTQTVIYISTKSDAHYLENFKIKVKNMTSENMSMKVIKDFGGFLVDVMIGLVVLCICICVGICLCCGVCGACNRKETNDDGYR